MQLVGPAPSQGKSKLGCELLRVSLDAQQTGFGDTWTIQPSSASNHGASEMGMLREARMISAHNR